MRSLIVILSLILPVSAGACPFCNIHNYMASSVIESESIVLGVVVHREGYEARIKVLESLRGDFAAGGEIEWNDVYAEVGDTAVFCKAPEGDFNHLFFSVYHPDAVPEIRFLASGDSVARNAAEARICLLGISAYSVSIGINYFESHPAELRQMIPAMLDSLLQVSCKGTNTRMFDWTFGNLCKTALKAAPSSVDGIIFSVLNAQSQCLVQECDYEDRYAPQHEAGYFYYQLLSQTKEQKARHLKLKTYFLKRMETASDAELCNLVFALVHSKALNEGELERLLIPGKNDAFAFGCLRASWQSESWWSWEHAERELNQAIAFEPGHRKLKRLIKEQQEDVLAFRRR